MNFHLSSILFIAAVTGLGAKASEFAAPAPTHRRVSYGDDPPIYLAARLGYTKPPQPAGQSPASGPRI